MKKKYVLLHLRLYSYNLVYVILLYDIIFKGFQDQISNIWSKLFLNTLKILFYHKKYKRYKKYISSD